MAFQNSIVKGNTFAQQLDAVNQSLVNIAIAGGGIVTESFADIQAIVRSGAASKFFKIGDQIPVSRGGTTLLWDIIGIDHDIPANPSLRHSMTLQLHDLWTSAMYFDAAEATWYIDSTTWPNGLAAGTYQFTLPTGYDTTYGGGATYHFTTTKVVPAGGQVYVEWAYQSLPTAGKVRTYSVVGTATELENVNIVAGSGGTAMPAIGETAVTENTNCVHRIRYGSNNWLQSGLRQWLNTDKAGGTWWTAQNNFDRPYGNASSDGFLRGMDAEFLAVVGEVRKDTQKPISDGYGMDNNLERFFLLSRPEVYCGAERSADGSDGTVYAYYKDYSDLASASTGADVNRIKYRGGSATYWGLRTPTSGNGYHVRSVSPDGSLNRDSANYSNGVAPACVFC